ncbi:MAG: GatB/YqeY domain-containing protein [bacterium]|nr:GatB/YqeY domain-containing protein [bacterium]
MSLHERIIADLTASMKAKDAHRTSVLRLLKTALDDAAREARASGTAFDDAAATARLQGEAKRLKESMAEFRAAGRDDLADATAGELTVVAAYLPQQLSEDEVRSVVARVQQETGATSMAALMGPAMSELKGRADGAVVRKIVEEVLGKA